ncbi:MAG: DUF1624 domain-containing protein [Candidatus Bathyarchaeota archaeon]|nr:MAG: DUF1624 domain-containing protein [Candidatus Bathyarchaeota archaeon]
MSKRLKHVDMIRGIAVLLMIVFQLLDMFSRDFGLYDTHYHFFRYVNWVPLFLIIAGFSLKLMFDNYDSKTFYSKILRRLLLFTSISWFIILWCQLDVNLLTFDGEIIGAIGLSLAFLSLFFLVETYQSSELFKVAWYGSWCFLAGFLNLFLQIQHGFFSFFWLQSFMTAGVLLATLRNHRNISLLSSLVLLSLGLINIRTVDIWSQNIELLLLNWGLTGIMLSVLGWMKANPLGRALSYFGRHTLFFYVLHYVLIYKVLNLTNSFKTFSIPEGIMLTLFSVLVITVLCKLKTHALRTSKLMTK